MRWGDGLVVNESSQANLGFWASHCTHLWQGGPAFNATLWIEQDSHTGDSRGGLCDTIFQIYYHRYVTPFQGACLSNQVILLLTRCPPLPNSHQNVWLIQLKHLSMAPSPHRARHMSSSAKEERESLPSSGMIKSLKCFPHPSLWQWIATTDHST